MKQDNSSNESIHPYSILITGARGFIGAKLVTYFTEHGIKVKAMSRQQIADTNSVKYVKADAFNVKEMTHALKDVDVAYYLLHSMEGDKQQWEDFAVREEIQAQNFVKAATASNVKRIIYLGGLTSDTSHLSRHMQSRRDVGKILASTHIPVTELQASIII